MNDWYISSLVSIKESHSNRICFGVSKHLAIHNLHTSELKLHCRYLGCPFIKTETTQEAFFKNSAPYGNQPFRVLVFFKGGIKLFCPIHVKGDL